MLLFVYTTTCKRFVIFTCRYFKLSWNTTALSQSNCRNFSCSSIKVGKGNRFVLSLEASSGLRFVVGDGKRLHQSWARLVLKKAPWRRTKIFIKLTSFSLPDLNWLLKIKIRDSDTTHCTCIFRVSYTMCPPEARLETSTRWPKWLQNLKATSFGSTHLNHLNMLLHLWWISLNYHGDF